MSRPSVHEQVGPPPIEEDIVELKDLSSLRDRVGTLRERGIEELDAITGRDLGVRTGSEADGAEEVAWAPLVPDDPGHSIEPADYVRPALVAMALARERRRERTASGSGAQRQLLDSIGRLQLDEILVTDAAGTRRHRVLRVPMLQSTRALQALMLHQDTSYSKASLICLYRIIRELYELHHADLSVGSARAAPGGISTAFMTAECIRAIRTVSRALFYSGKSLAAILDYAEMRMQREAMKILPAKWRISEAVRFGARLETELWSFGPKAGFAIAVPRLDRLTGRDHGVFVEEFTNVVRALLVSCRQIRDDAIAVIEETRKLVIKDASEQRGHERAFDSLQRGQRLVEEGIRLCEMAMASPGPASEGHTPLLRSFAELLEAESNEVERVLRPARVFIEGVMDRELAMVHADSRHAWNAPELLSAAAAFSALTGDYEDARLMQARGLLIDELSPAGRFKTSLSIDTDHHGYTLTVSGFELLRAMAQLLEKVPGPLTPEVVRRMLTYFQATAVRKRRDGSLGGWTQEHPRTPRWCYRWTTALAVLALDRLEHTLDEHINRRVFSHFSTVMTEPAGTPDLTQLIAPDVGLNGQASDYATSKPVCLELERMRAHVLGVPAPSAFDGAAWSVVLYGPPGTGKTTLLESLAASSDVPLVEVSPSDIILQGETAMERRARAVFDALSILKRAVVILDEFEPVLRSRELRAKENEPPSAYSFLTPGMLPKLKKLNTAAGSHQVVYGLMTNRIADLDRAAIREGRFDLRIGVFPPDVLSRTGRLFYELGKAESQIVAAREEASKSGGSASAAVRRIAELEVRWGRASSLVKKSSGAGMTSLSIRGNLLGPRDLLAIPVGTMFADLVGARSDVHDEVRFVRGAPDAVPRGEDPDEEEDLAKLESLQWYLIQHWESEAGTQGGEDPVEFSEFVDSLPLPALETLSAMRREDVRSRLSRDKRP